MRIRLNLAYDGSEFLGWQVQSEGRTVQGELENALSSFYGGTEIRTHASGRTDAGVHATGQVVHYDTEIDRPDDKIIKGLNSLLPDDVHIWRARQVPDDFHARFSARGRIYRYRILREPDLFMRRYGWCPRDEFDPSIAQNVSSIFLGKHDFRAFSTQPDLEQGTVCNVLKIEWTSDALGWLFEIEADRFVRRMVRSLVGSLVAAGAGEVTEKELIAALEKQDARTPPPAPPQGLALLHVRYETDDPHDRPSQSLWGKCAAR